MTRCYKCGADLDKRWSYCPFCGTETSKLKRFMEFGMEAVLEKMLETLDFSLKSLLADRSEEQKRHRVLKIKITPTDRDCFKMHGSSNGLIERDSEKTNRKPEAEPRAVVEPEAEIRKDGSELMITLKIPGVRRESDIQLIRLEESTELRARAKDKMYFKILDVPKSFVLKEKILSDDKITLKFSLV